MSILFRAISFLTGCSTSHRWMNPLASGAFFFTSDAGIKCRVSVRVVSPFGGIGGRLGRGLPPGGWAKVSWANRASTAKASAWNRGLMGRVIAYGVIVG